jgi:FkbM family methyltransferase
VPILDNPYPPLKRLGRGIRLALARLQGADTSLAVDTRIPGLRFRVMPQDDVGRHIARDGVHEPANTAWLLANLKLAPTDVVVDVGANIGWYSLLLGQIGGGKVDVYAFEPEPLNFANLRENIALNGASRIVPQQLALGERSGSLDLYLYKDSNRGRHSALPIHDGHKISVPVMRLDEWWEKSGLRQRTLRFLKIDVEGYELPALQGAGELLQRCQTLMLEYSPAYMRRAGLEPADLLQLLQRAGFQVHRLVDGALAPIARDTLLAADMQLDLFARR